MANTAMHHKTQERGTRAGVVRSAGVVSETRDRRNSGSYAQSTSIKNIDGITSGATRYISCSQIGNGGESPSTTANGPTLNGVTKTMIQRRNRERYRANGIRSQRPAASGSNSTKPNTPR